MCSSSQILILRSSIIFWITSLLYRIPGHSCIMVDGNGFDKSRKFCTSIRKISARVELYRITGRSCIIVGGYCFDKPKNCVHQYEKYQQGFVIT
jgi:hypothetical protein